jgi:hypothetical protein
MPPNRIGTPWVCSNCTVRLPPNSSPSLPLAAVDVLGPFPLNHLGLPAKVPLPAIKNDPFGGEVFLGFSREIRSKSPLPAISLRDLEEDG